ncbi:(deoxy)nucleoside triphosphate pyrophosphohydrolase [Flavobacterium ponti]|uniref:8-oxo-dGTP diphosphatase n=1 Tax=Flavobacterium ponti TaxID=665133 RepID=A0ABV9P5I6_9FLAO
MKNIEVVAAIIFYKDEILCVQKGLNKLNYLSEKYEFPGGKMEFGETKEQTITREIFEELEMNIIINEEFITVNYQYPDFNLKMHSFICTCRNKKLTLTEHIDFKWLKKEELKTLNWAAADIPIVNKLVMNG